MNFLFKGISIILLVPGLLLLTACRRSGSSSQPHQATANQLFVRAAETVDQHPI